MSNARVKARRGHLRSQVTKMHGKLDTILASEHDEIQASLDRIKEIEVDIKAFDDILYL